MLPEVRKRGRSDSDDKDVFLLVDNVDSIKTFLRGDIQLNKDALEVYGIDSCMEILKQLQRRLFWQAFFGKVDGLLWQTCYSFSFAFCTNEFETHLFEWTKGFVTEQRKNVLPFHRSVATLFSPETRQRFYHFLWVLKVCGLQNLAPETRLHIFRESLDDAPLERGCAAVLSSASYLEKYYLPNRAIGWGEDLESWHQWFEIPTEGTVLLQPREEEEEAQEVPLVKSQVFQFYSMFCDRSIPIYTHLDSEVCNKVVCFLNDGTFDGTSMTQAVLFEVILASNFFSIAELLDASCKTVSDLIKGKTPEELRKTFNIKNDFTPEEEEQVRRENEWCEERNV